MQEDKGAASESHNKTGQCEAWLGQLKTGQTRQQPSGSLTERAECTEQVAEEKMRRKKRGDNSS